MWKNKVTYIYIYIYIYIDIYHTANELDKNANLASL